MISFSKVTKRYPGGLEALRGVTLTIAAGAMVFITGHSGAGKTTLLKLMAAIERPTSGSVVVNGQNVGALRPRAVPFLRRKLGLIFQDQKLLFDRTAFDNVMLPQARLEPLDVGWSGIERQEHRELGVGSERAREALQIDDRHIKPDRQRERDADDAHIEQRADRRAREARDGGGESIDLMPKPGLHAATSTRI